MSEFPVFDRLEQSWAQLPARPRDRGTVELVVLRTGDGAHDMPPGAQLSVDGGVVGDRWSRGDEPDPAEQVTLMMVQVARLITATDTLHLPGDNFLVDLDLSEDNLPAGTRIRLGEAVVEISDKPHTGCKKFSERFGPEALRWVNWKPHRPRRLRGVNARVVEGGRVELGAAVIVVR